MASDTVPATSVAGRARTIARRRALPRGRAIVGGLLVAVAAVTVFAAYRRAEAPPTTRFVVAAHDLGPGQILTAADIGLVAIDLPPDQARTAHTNEAELEGAVAAHMVAAGAIVRAGDVLPPGGVVAGEEVSFPIPASHAGSLQPGERVDVVATYGSGSDAVTVHVVADALVLSASAADRLAGSDTIDVRLGVAEPADALAVAHAATQAEMFLVRSPGDGPAVSSYTAPNARTQRHTDDGIVAGAPSLQAP